MAGQDAEDFDFSDDGLDSLDDTLLQELEQQAILSTQQQRSATNHDQSYPRPAVPVAATGPRHDSALAQQHAAKESSSDYGGFDEEDVIDLDNQPAPPLQSHAQNTVQGVYQQSRGGPSLASRQPISAPTRALAHRAAPKHYMTNDVPVPRSVPSINTAQHDFVADEHNNMDISGLLARIQELERDRDTLQTSFQEAQSKVMSQRGEISIVRSKFDQAKREYEVQMNRMQQLHEQQIARQRAELEQANKERETAETNNRFLEHDLAQEKGRASLVRRPAKDVVASKARPKESSPAVTPRKSRQLPFRDGFDDEDIVMVSPSRGREKSKPATPKAGSKRKRSVADQSPGLALPMSEPRPVIKPQESVESHLSVLDSEALEQRNGGNERFEFLHRFLSYTRKSPKGKEHVLDALKKFCFPSAPDRTLSSSMYDGIASLSHSDSTSFSAGFFGIIIQLWGQCLQEKLYGPLDVLLDTLLFLLSHEPMKSAEDLTDSLVPLIQATIDLVALPIGRAAANAVFARERDSAVQLQINQDIDVDRLLLLLNEIALACINGSTESITRFWQLIQHDFVLLMLMKGQAFEHSLLMLRVLATSGLETSIGALVPNNTAEQQIKRENLLLDRLTSLLFEVPEAPRGQEPYMEDDILSLRLEVLNVLRCFAQTTYGGEALARHRILLGSLIRFLDSTISSLYTFIPALQASIVDAINTSMSLVYHLVKTYPQVADLRVKINSVHGGQHKHLVAFTRLAFSESLLLERGIAEEVMDMAQELLESVLTPEEAEQVENVFSTGRSAA